MQEAEQSITPMQGVELISESQPSVASAQPEAVRDAEVSKGFTENQKRCLWVSLDDFVSLLRLLLEQLGTVGLPKQAYVDWSKVGKVLKKPAEDCEILFWNFKTSHWRPSLELIVMEAPYPPLAYPGHMGEDAPPDPLVLELKDAMLTRMAYLLRCLHEAEKPLGPSGKAGLRGADGKKPFQPRNAIGGIYMAGAPEFFSSAAYAIPFQQQLLQQQVIQQQMACYLQRQQHASQDMGVYTQLPVSTSALPYPPLPFAHQHNTSMPWNGFPVSGNPPGSAAPFVAPHWSLLAAQRPAGSALGATPASSYMTGGLPSVYEESSQMGIAQRHPLTLAHWSRATQSSSPSQLVVPVRYWRPTVTVGQCGAPTSDPSAGARGVTAGSWPVRPSQPGMAGGMCPNPPYSHGASLAVPTMRPAAQTSTGAYPPLAVNTQQQSVSNAPCTGPLGNGLPAQRPAYP